MKTQPTPTSPKYKTDQPSGAKVWTTGELQKPMKTPYGRITLLIIFCSLVISAGAMAGLAWAVARYPHTWLARFVPKSSTTVVEKTTANSTKIPSAVLQAAKTLYGNAIDQGDQGIYLPGHVVGQSVPLSNNGWLVTLPGALPAGDAALALLPSLGQPLGVKLRTTDPATPFLFLKTDGLNQSPATIAAVTEPTEDGQAVWVASQTLQQTTIIARRLSAATTLTWISSDKLERHWQLDAPTTLPVGSAVLNQSGHFIGLLGENNRVWELAAIEPALKQLIQGGTIDRPWFGISYVDRSGATMVSQPVASGWLIGAPTGGTAVALKSPAEKAGLKSGDLIVTFDGQPASGDLFSSLLRFHPGDTVKVSYERAGQKKETEVTLGVFRP